MTNNLDRITINLTHKVKKMVDDLALKTGETKTTVVNRYVSVFYYLDEQMGKGDEIIVRSNDGTEKRIKFF